MNTESVLSSGFHSVTGQKSSQPQTSSVADTNALVAGTLCGKGLKQNRGRLSESPQAGMQQQQQQQKMQSKFSKIIVHVHVL